MHGEFLLLGDEKMSKATGKFVRLDTLVDWGIHPLAYRYFLLGAHYRSKLTFAFEAIVGARAVLLRILRTVRALANRSSNFASARALVAEIQFSRGGSFDYARGELDRMLSAGARAWVEKLDQALSRDLNTPEALAHLGALIDDASLGPEEAIALLGIYDLVLGLGLLDLEPEALAIRPRQATLTDQEVTELVRGRDAARTSGDYRKADQIRDRLKQESIALSDSPAGTRWEWAPVSPP